MDAERFDSLTRTFSAASSRRTLLGTSFAGLASALGVAYAAAKKKGKGKGKKNKGKDKDKDKRGCSRANCSGCCDGDTCHPGTANDRCERDGFECENCAVQGLICNENQSCGCDGVGCYARKQGCCLFDETCEAGTTTEACGPIVSIHNELKSGCDVCRDHEICTSHLGSRFCCGQQGAFCGVIQGGLGGANRVIPCCEGFECGEDELCHTDSCAELSSNAVGKEGACTDCTNLNCDGVGEEGVCTDVCGYPCCVGFADCAGQCDAAKACLVTTC